MEFHPNYSGTGITSSNISRRDLLRHSAVLGLSSGIGGPLLAACGSDGGSTQGTEQWDFLWYIPTAESAQVDGLTNFAEGVGAQTDGKVDVRSRPAGELPYDATEYVQVVGQGRAEMADAAASFVAGSLSTGEFPNLPFLARTEDELTSLMAMVEGPMREELESQGATLLYWYTMPPIQIWGSGNPVASLDDLRGRKLRTFADQQNDYLSTLGAEGVSVTTAEVVSALQTNVIDGVITSGLAALSFGWYEFMDWVYVASMHYAPNYVIVNSEALASLDTGTREGLQTAAAQAQSSMLGDVLAAGQGDMDTLTGEHGIEANEMSAEDVRQSIEIMKPVWEEWAQSKSSRVQQTMQDVLAELGL